MSLSSPESINLVDEHGNTTLSTTFPGDSEIIAELSYKFDEVEWAACVVLDEDDDGVACFRLWYRQKNRFQKSGVFYEGSPLASYLRSQAKTKFEGRTSIRDSLGSIEGRVPSSVVPECHHKYARYEKCESCPYETSCFPPGTVPMWKRGGMPIVSGQRIAASIAERKESEVSFMKRLREKVTKQWGSSEDSD